MQLKYHIPHILFLTTGIAGMFFFTMVDFIRAGTLHFGTNQLAGFVISTIIVLAGMHNTTSPRAKTWFGALLLLYLAGIFYMGLKPTGPFSHLGHFHHHSDQLLIISRPPIKDFIINILGFCPFAYLFMAYLYSGKPIIFRVLPMCLVLLAGIGSSLFIEIVQFYIPGRTSSMMDLIANAVGTMIGIAYFILEQKLADFR